MRRIEQRERIKPLGQAIGQKLLRIDKDVDFTTLYVESNGREDLGVSADVCQTNRVYKIGSGSQLIYHEIQSTDTPVVVDTYRSEITPSNGITSKCIEYRRPYVFGVGIKPVTWNMAAGQDASVLQFHNGNGDGDGAGAASSTLNLSILSGQWVWNQRYDEDLVSGGTVKHPVLTIYSAPATQGIMEIWTGELCFDWAPKPGGSAFTRLWRNGNMIVNMTEPNAFNDSLLKFGKCGIYQWDAWSGVTTRTVHYTAYYLIPMSVGITAKALYRHIANNAA